MPIWKPHHLDAGGCYEAKIGLLRVRLRHTFQDWYVASELLPYRSRKELLETHFRSVKDGTGEWRRWVFEKGTHTATLVPMMPNRSVVVQPEIPLWIPPSERALLFVTVPLWVAVTVGEEKPSTLCELATTSLSNTWFGDYSTGELCYSLRSRAKRGVEPLERTVHNAICPVQLANASSTALAFEHLCIRAEHLSVYDVPGRMWTNLVEVVYQGGDQQSQVTIVPGPPTAADGARLASSPRKPAQQSLVHKSFQLLRTLTGT